MPRPSESGPATRFAVRFVVAVLAGTVAGLLVGAVGRYAFHTGWNLAAAASWGIMAAAVGLIFYELWRGTPARRNRT